MSGSLRAAAPCFFSLLISAAAPVCAAPAPQQGPCAFVEIDVAKYGLAPFQNPPDLPGENGSLTTELAVELTDPSATAIAGCSVSLRTYNGRLVGPTLRLRPGGTLNLRLSNQLPAESAQQVADQAKQQAEQAFLATAPHSYNTTNLHTHGLHVSPQGNSDNVLLAIPPQTDFLYEIKVPANHPPGTFWYHAHTHGSTAIQVGSGMAGALIIEDAPAALPPALLAATEREKVLIIQTILYDATGEANDITAFFPDSPSTKTLCEQGNSGCTWQNSRRRITINGQIVPVIRMRPGEVQRWRLIDAAFRESLNLRLEGHTLYEIALDGLYLGRVDAWGPDRSIELQSGYRSDVLVQARSEPGRYRLIDAASAANVSLRGIAEPENVLAEVVVEGEPLPMELPTSDQMAALAPFPGVDLSETADGVQTAVFQIGSAYNAKDKRNYFQINSHPFDPSRIRTLRLGETEMWSLSTVGDPTGVPNCAGQDPDTCGPIPALPHVFHIHVNPFQVARQDPQGNREMVWKDTVLIPPGQTLNIFTRYLDYIGQFVMHCHILDHEDLGMMELVEVVGQEPFAPGHIAH